MSTPCQFPKHNWFCWDSASTGSKSSAFGHTFTPTDVCLDFRKAGLRSCWKGGALRAKYHKDQANLADDEDEHKKQLTLSTNFKKIAHALGSKNRKNNIVSELGVSFSKTKAEFYDMLDENPNLLGFENGVFDFTISEFRDGRPEDMLSMSVGYNYTNEVDEDIRGEIMNFYDSIFYCAEVRDYKLMCNAYQLHGNKYLEIFWIWTGKGRNGKSVEAYLLEKTFGQYAYDPDITMFTTKKNDASKANPELAKAKGKRILIASEPDKHDKLISSQLKAWTGNDKIQARDLYVKNVEFYLQCGINILCNTIPKFTTLAEAEAARTKIVHYPFEFVESPTLPRQRKMDVTLKQKFKDVRYAQQYMLILLEMYAKHVKGEKHIPTPDKVNVVTKQYFNDQDVVGQFIDECLEITDKKSDKIEKKDMYSNFMEHLKNEGMQEDEMISKAFHKQMQSKGFDTKKQYYYTMRFKHVSQSQIHESDDEL